MFERSSSQPLGRKFQLDTKRALLHPVLSSGGSETLTIQEFLRTEVLKVALSFWADSVSWQPILLPTPNKAPEKSSWRFKYSLLYHTEHSKISGLLVSAHYGNGTSSQQKYFVQWVSFSELCKNKIISDFCSLRHIVFHDNLPFTSQVLPTQTTHPFLAHKSQDRFNSTKYTARMEQLGVFFAPMVWYDHTTFKMEQSKESNIIKYWTLRSGQELSSSHEMSFFQQRGASRIPPPVRSLFDKMYLNSWIGICNPRGWWARSPDQTTMEFSLWKFVKCLMYPASLFNVTHLERRVKRAVWAFSQGVPKTYRKVKNRLNTLIWESGGHIEH